MKAASFEAHNPVPERHRKEKNYDLVDIFSRIAVQLLLCFLQCQLIVASPLAFISGQVTPLHSVYPLRPAPAALAPILSH